MLKVVCEHSTSIMVTLQPDQSQVVNVIHQLHASDCASVDD